MAAPKTPLSPTFGSSVGNKRKIAAPTLPASAFTVAESSTTPAPKQPSQILDAHQGGRGTSSGLTFESFSLDGPSDTSSAAKEHLIAEFTGSETAAAAKLEWARKSAKSIDIIVKGDISSNDSHWEALESLLASSTPGAPIILSNVLPPPTTAPTTDSVTLGLATSPVYQTYQAHIAALSLFPGIFIKFLPPQWPLQASGSEDSSVEDLKTRVKLYFVPALEAFGEDRIMFGSSSAVEVSSSPDSWQSTVFATLSELAVEQPTIDAVFSKTASKVYA